MIVANLIYAMVCAQVLFGDLFNSRMCNALHALPLRRESWFGIHILSGLCFSLIPNFVFTLLLSSAGQAVQLFWLLQSTLQFVFYFGTAVLCAQLVGSRFAMVVVYGLINFASLVAFWLLGTLYIPLLPGVILRDEIFQMLCPVVNFFVEPPMDAEFTSPDVYILTHIDDGWIYLAIVAAVGVVFGVLALVLYRRRNLETAGDFIAVNWLKPVFLVSYTFVVTAFFQLLADLFLNEGGDVFLLLGIAVGYFTAQMFLMRTTKVFKKKPLIGFAVFTLAVLLSLGITVLDPLGISRWVPDSTDVESVYLEQYGTSGTFTDADKLEQIEAFHSAVIPGYRGVKDGDDIRIGLSYTLKNGRSVRREYWVDDHSEAGERLRPVISSPEFVLQGLEKDWKSMGYGFRIGYYSAGNDELVPRELYAEFMECLIKDCEAGNLPQHWWDWNDSDIVFEMHMETQYTSYGYRYCNIEVTEKAVHTYNWLKQQEFYREYYLKNR
jgi:ABC-2 type transport system permease protein